MKQHPVPTDSPPPSFNVAAAFFSLLAPPPPRSLNAANKNNTAPLSSPPHHRENRRIVDTVNYKNNSAKRSNNRSLHSQWLVARVISLPLAKISLPIQDLRQLLPSILSSLSLSSIPCLFILLLYLGWVKIVGKTESKKGLADSKKDSIFL